MQLSLATSHSRASSPPNRSAVGVMKRAPDGVPVRERFSVSALASTGCSLTRMPFLLLLLVHAIQTLSPAATMQRGDPAAPGEPGGEPGALQRELHTRAQA